MRRSAMVVVLALGVGLAGCTTAPPPEPSASPTSPSPTTPAPTATPAQTPSTQTPAGQTPTPGTSLTPDQMAALVGAAMAPITSVLMTSTTAGAAEGQGAVDTDTWLDWADRGTPKADSTTDDEAGLTRTVQIGQTRYTTTDAGATWQVDTDVPFAFPTTLGPSYWTQLFTRCGTTALTFAGADEVAGAPVRHYTATSAPEATTDADSTTLGGLWLDAHDRVVQLTTLDWLAATTQTYSLADFDVHIAIDRPA